ncbi:MAG: HAMP domain-containing histidine kinase [Lachnospiraceae bacterium]|nr:HAMP domain-containing histidine kinase [Lachnospiraceae bacterium]
MVQGNRKEKRKKGSIFWKLIVSYVIFSMIAIVVTMISVAVSIFISFGGSINPYFPGILVEDGKIGNLTEIDSLGGWVEELDENYQVVNTYGRKQTSEQSYTPEQLLAMTAQKKAESIYTYDKLPASDPSGYYIYWQQREGGYYLMFYPRDSFMITYNFDIDKVFTTNVGNGVLLVILTLLLIDVFCMSFYIFKKIKRPLDGLIYGMERVEQGEEKVEFPLQTEREFVEIGEAFNRMTERLALQKAENEKMAKSRQKMLLELSHDIKTPVATIKSYASALEEGMVPEGERLKYYQTIALKADRVNNMSEDLFTMLKMESTDYPLELIRIDFAELTRQICAEYYEEITGAGFVFDVEIPENAIYVKGDEKLLTRVIGNLLINAKKYNRTGRQIKINIKEEKKQVCLSVTDDGDLIEQAVRNTMFTAFVRGESARNSSGGTGLGLAIAKAVMEKHGGSIYYREENGCNVFGLRLALSEGTQLHIC